jgi:hypothetical protein
MGWWDSKAGLIGDGPVDLVEQCLSAWPDAGDPPTWQRLLDAVGAALMQGGSHWLADPQALADGRVRARFASPGTDLVGQPGAAREDDVAALAEAFAQVAEEYEETQARRPTASEALATLAFSLRSRPERFLRNDEGRKLRDLVAGPPGERA